MYLVFALAALGLLLIVAFVIRLSISLSRELAPKYAEIPHISGKVADAVSGDPLPGMDVCLLETYVYNGPSDGSGHEIKVRRSEATRTDASGTFSFTASRAQMDWVHDADSYGIAVTDPAARFDEACGKSIYLLGGSSSAVFQSEFQFRSEPSRSSRYDGRPPYFPVALVQDPTRPYPLLHYTDPPGFKLGFPLAAKLDDPGSLKIGLIPLLRDAKECQSAQDSSAAELCKQANNSRIADALRKGWNLSPERR